MAANLMDFRRAEPEHFPQLAQMRWDFRAESGDESPVVSPAEFLAACIDYLHAGWECQSRAYWIAEENGFIISHLFVQTVEMMPRPCRLLDAYGYLTNSYTRPAYRGRGIGTALLAAVIEWAREKDLELLLTWPSESAAQFYERAGFVRSQEIWTLSLRAY